MTKKRPDEWDENWQHEAWKALAQHGGWSDDLLWGRENSILTQMAPAGTAMVQFLNGSSDIKAVAGYMTKCWKKSPFALADRCKTPSYEEAHDFKLLEEFHAPVTEFARLHRFDSKGAKVLDLDKPLRWKHRGHTVH